MAESVGWICERCAGKKQEISDAHRKWCLRSSLMRWKSQILMCRNARARLFLFFPVLIMWRFWCACGTHIRQTLLNFPLQFLVILFAPAKTSSCSISESKCHPLPLWVKWVKSQSLFPSLDLLLGYLIPQFVRLHRQIFPEIKPSKVRPVFSDPAKPN